MDTTENQLPEEAGDLDWESLEAKAARTKSAEEVYDDEAIAAEKKRLSEKEKSLPYPEDFLADINLLHKSLKNQTLKGDEGQED